MRASKTLKARICIRTSEGGEKYSSAKLCRLVFGCVPQALLVGSSLRTITDGLVLSVRDGPKVMTSLKQSPQLAGFCIEEMHAPQRSVELTLRGVPPSFSTEEILEELRSLAGAGNVLSLRRLHARTEGVIDPSRPISRLIVVATTDGAKGLTGHQVLFGGLRVSLSGAREQAPKVQCDRCFGWGHTSGTCSRRRLCRKCGSRDHLAAACSEISTSPKCFACGGGHSPRYAGCPARRQEEMRVKEALSPPTPCARVQPGVSYASVAAGGPPVVPSMAPTTPTRTCAPTPAPTPAGVSERAAKSRSIAFSLRDRRGRLREIEEQIERVDNARRLEFNASLQSRAKYLRNERRKVRRRIESLETERRELSAEGDATPTITAPVAQNTGPSAQNTGPSTQSAQNTGPSAQSAQNTGPSAQNTYATSDRGQKPHPGDSLGSLLSRLKETLFAAFPDFFQSGIGRLVATLLDLVPGLLGGLSQC